MSTKQVFGLIGSAILSIGVFVPIISIPIVGSINYFNNGKGDGVLILILAIISFVFVLMKKYKVLWFTGISSLAIVMFDFINLQMKMSEMLPKFIADLFPGLADIATQSIQLQWGWALLAIGAVLVIASAAVKDDSNKNY